MTCRVLEQKHEYNNYIPVSNFFVIHTPRIDSQLVRSHSSSMSSTLHESCQERVTTKSCHQMSERLSVGCQKVVTQYIKIKAQFTNLRMLIVVERYYV